VTAIAAPSDRRFRRAHVKPSKRRRGWRGLVVPMAVYGVLAVAAIVSAYWGVALVAEGRVLPIDRIVVRGNARLSRGEVLALLDGLRGESLLGTDLDVWRRRLLASAWVRDAALRRSLPSTIEVVVKERQPMGIARTRDGMYLIDERGAVIDQFGPQYLDLDLPIVDGLLAPGSGGAPVDQAHAALAARVLTELEAAPAVWKQVSQVNVTDVHNTTVILDGDTAVVELGDGAFLERLESYLDLAATLHAQVADIDYVDMRFDNRVYVRPAGPAARTAR
jgi:cell division protein FtsQ